MASTSLTPKSPLFASMTLVIYLCHRSVGACRIFDKFLDDYGVVGGAKVNDLSAGGVLASYDLFTDEPTQELLGCLAAMIAADKSENAFGGRQRHVDSPLSENRIVA